MRATPIRVAFVLPSFSGGGAERVLLSFAGALDRTRFSPEIVVLHGGGPWRSLVPSDVPLIDLGKQRIRNALPSLALALRKRRPDVVISTIGALNLALLALRPVLPRRTRIVVREANTPHHHARGRIGARFYRWAYRRLYRRAARVIVPASYLGRELIEDFGVPPGPIAVVPNPVDEAGLRAAAVPVDRAPGPGAVFVSVGRLTRQKGFDRVIDMMAAGRQNARLSILGDGPDRGFLEGRVRALGLEGRVTFAGFVRDAAQRIAGADALLLPSRWEGLPNVALEALALGVPVIATPEAGGIREIAALAPPGAITLAPAGPDFVAAMASVTVCSNGTLRPSLLPSTFKLETAVARFAELIAAA